MGIPYVVRYDVFNEAVLLQCPTSIPIEVTLKYECADQAKCYDFLSALVSVLEEYAFTDFKKENRKVLVPEISSFAIKIVLRLSPLSSTIKTRDLIVVSKEIADLIRNIAAEPQFATNIALENIVIRTPTRGIEVLR